MVLRLIKVPMNMGAGKVGTELAPDIIGDHIKRVLDVPIEEELIKCQSCFEFSEPIVIGNMMFPNEICKSCLELSNECYSALKDGEFPLVVGGDHSLSWGGRLRGLVDFMMIWVLCISMPTGTVIFLKLV